MLKLIDINGRKFVINFVATGPDTGLQLQCLDQEREQSYTESLSASDFSKRLKALNARVKFPEDDVRVALVRGDPTHSSLSEANQDAGCVLQLKYKMLNNMPLKWEWHLAHMDRALFYRKVFLDSISCASNMRDQVFSLTKQLQAKDEELKQYRIEGAQLRRGTVATKLFDMDAFKEMHEQMLTGSAIYRQLTEAFDVKGSSLTLVHGKIEASKVSDATNSPASHSSNSTQKLSPRNRKRKAMESAKYHIERKVLRRRAQGPIEYKESQSTQEEIEDDLFALNEAEAATHNNTQEPPVVKAENIKKESVNRALAPQLPVVKAENIKKESVDSASARPVTAAKAFSVLRNREKRRALHARAVCEASIFKQKSSVEIPSKMMDPAATEPPVGEVEETLNQYKPIYDGAELASKIIDLDIPSLPVAWTANAAPSGLDSVLGSLKEMESFISKTKNQI